MFYAEFWSVYACCNDRCISISRCLWLAIQSLWELPRGRLWTHPKHQPLSHTRLSEWVSEWVCKIKRFLSKESKQWNKAWTSTWHHDPQHNFNSISPQMNIIIVCTHQSGQVDGWVIIWWLQTIIELSLTAGAALCSLSSEWPEVTSYTEFLWFSEFSCHQAADSLLSLNTKEEGTTFYPLSHCTLFHSSVQCSCLCETHDVLSDQVTHARCPECVSLVSEGTGHHYRAADVSWPGHLLSSVICVAATFIAGRE